MALNHNSGTKSTTETSVKSMDEGLNTVHQKNILTHAQVGDIANKMMVHLDGLNKISVELILKWINTTVDSNYLLSIKPNSDGNK